MRFTSGFLLFPYFFFWVSCVCHPSAFLVNEIRDAFFHDFLQPPYACAGVDPVVDERAAGVFHIAAGCCHWFCLCKIIFRTREHALNILKFFRESSVTGSFAESAALRRPPAPVSLLKNSGSVESGSMITGMRSWMKRIPSPAGCVRITKWGNRDPSASVSIRYRPAISRCIWPDGWSMYLFPRAVLPEDRFGRSAGFLLLPAGIFLS